MCEATPTYFKDVYKFCKDKWSKQASFVDMQNAISCCFKLQANKNSSFAEYHIMNKEYLAQSNILLKKELMDLPLRREDLFLSWQVRTMTIEIRYKISMIYVKYFHT